MCNACPVNEILSENHLRIRKSALCTTSITTVFFSGRASTSFTPSSLLRPKSPRNSKACFQWLQRTCCLLSTLEVANISFRASGKKYFCGQISCHKLSTNEPNWAIKKAELHSLKSRKDCNNSLFNFHSFIVVAPHRFSVGRRFANLAREMIFKLFTDGRPIYDLPKGVDIRISIVTVVSIVSMFPKVKSQQRIHSDLMGVSVVFCCDNVERAVRCSRKEDPARSK